MTDALPHPSFVIVLRGYNRVEVEAFVDEVTRTRRFHEPPEFMLVMRGYDRSQVDEWIARARAVLPLADS